MVYFLGKCFHLSGLTFSGIRNRHLYPTTLSLGYFNYENYATVVRKILDEYTWTSVCFVYDTSQQIPFNQNLFTRVDTYLRRNAKYIQIVSFPHNASIYVDYDDVLDDIAKICRSN